MEDKDLWHHFATQVNLEVKIRRLLRIEADPLGPTSIGPGGQPQFSATGAPQIRSTLFNYLNQSLPSSVSAGNTYAGASQGAAANPGWATAAGNANQNAAGDYLAGSPQLDTALATQRGQTMADAANQDARIKSQFTQNGMGWSTGQQQAQEANNAAAGAQAANTSAQTYLQNYMNERANQNNAGTQLATATSQPLNYLSGVAGATQAPLAGAGNLISGLSSGGQVFQTGSQGNNNSLSTPSILSSL